MAAQYFDKHLRECDDERRAENNYCRPDSFLKQEIVILFIIKFYVTLACHIKYVLRLVNNEAELRRFVDNRAGIR